MPLPRSGGLRLSRQMDRHILHHFSEQPSVGAKGVCKAGLLLTPRNLAISFAKSFDRPDVRAKCFRHDRDYGCLCPDQALA